VRLHEASLRILGEVGVKILSRKVQKLLAEKGAKVDAARSIVRIPSSMVEEALELAPNEMVLCGRERRFDLKIPAEESGPFVATSGFASFIRDFETGERRMSRSSDLRDFAVLSDYLDEVDFFWPIVAPTEVPAPIQHVHGLAISLKNTVKHIQYQALSGKEARWQILLAAAIVGGKEELRRRPIFSSINCSVSPLMFEKGSSEAMAELARAGIPVAPESIAMCGTTAPATVAGTMAIANSENLASLAILQCASPGAPMIYCVEATSADMRTGGVNYGAPELPLIEAGLVQMARFYELPVWAVGGRSFVRYDITASFGGLDTALSAALEKLVLDAEAYNNNRRAYWRRFSIDEETLAFDAIKKAGPGGTFIGLKHTLEHFQKEIWLKGSPPPRDDAQIDRAKEKVKKILKEHSVPPLDKDIQKELDNIIKRAEKELPKKFQSSNVKA